MSSWIVSLGLLLVLPGQVDAGDTDPAANQVANQAIREAVDQLGAAQFSVRRRASQFLWRQGVAAEPALIRAAASPDREVRIRAELILNDFRYGILPGVPPDIVALIRQFRDGDAAQRLAALERLADRDCFDPIQRLIRLEPDEGVRRQLLVYLMENPRAVERFFEPERLEQLVAAVGADRDATWRRTVLAQLLFSPKMIQQLADKDRLDVLARVVDRERSADVRRQMLSMLFQNAEAVSSLVENDQLAFVLRVITKEPDEKTRGAWISQLLAMSGVIQRLADDDRLEQLLQFAQQNVGEAQRSEILERLFRSSAVVKAVLAKRGVERLIALTALEKTPAARGRILAALVTSMAVREHLTQSGQHDLAIKLARRETSPIARGEYLKEVLNSVIGYSLVRDQTSRTALWSLLKADGNRVDEQQTDWRGVALLRMLTMSSGHELLQDADEAAWLVRFLGENMTPAERATIVERLVSNYRLKQALLQHKHFDDLLKLVKQLPASQRGRALGQLFASSDPFQGNYEPQDLGLMISLARDEPEDEARRQYLQALFRNQSAMNALIAADRYGDLWTLICNEQDPLEHAILRGEFLRTSGVVQAIAGRQELDSLLDFARQADDAEVRREYLKRLFDSTYAMSALIDQGHYDALWALAGGDQDPDARLRLVSQFYRNTRVVQQLIETDRAGLLLDFALEHVDEKQTATYLQHLFFNRQAVAALVEQGRIEVMLTLARRSQDKYMRASLLRAIFGVPEVVSHFADNEQLDEMFAQINDEEPEVRYQIYYNLTLRSDTQAVLIERGWIENLLQAISTQVEPKQRGQLLGRLVVNSKIVDYLKSRKQLERVFQLAGQLDEPHSRQQYLQAVLSSSAVVGELIEQGHFEDLLRLASGHSDPGMRTRLRASLLTNSRAVEHLVAENKIDLLLTLIGEQTDQATRVAVVSRIVASSSAVSALIEHDKFSQLVDLCTSVADAEARSRLMGELLQSGQAVRQLAAGGDLETFVHDVLRESDPTDRKHFLLRLFSDRDAVAALVAHGQFDGMLQAAEAITDANDRRNTLGNLVGNAAAMHYLAAQGRIDLVLRIIADESQPIRRRHYLINFLYQSESVAAALAGGHFDRLLELIGELPDDSTRHTLLVNVLFHPTAVEHLVESGDPDRFAAILEQFENPDFNRSLVHRFVHSDSGYRLLAEMQLGGMLLSLIESEPEATYQDSYARRILASQQLWQALIDSGQVQVIYEAANWVSDEEYRRTSLQEMLYAPTGLIAYHLRHGETELVERLLEKHADNDLGRVRLATYLLATGRLQARIDQVQEELATAGTGSATGDDVLPADRRLLVYLLRAAGDLEAAREAAEPLVDSGLLRALSVEAGYWSQAAELIQADPQPLPIPGQSPSPGNSHHQRAEQLGLLAAYQRLAGAREACDNTLAEFLQLAEAHPDDHSLTWFCVEALLLNGRVQDGLDLMAETEPRRAFDLYLARREYGRALALAGYQPDAQLDQQWLQSLPVGGAEDSRAVLARIEFALEVAQTLHSLGRSDEAHRVLDLLADNTAGQPPDEDHRDVQRQCWERLIAGHLKIGDVTGAWDMAAQASLDANATLNLLVRLYPRRHSEARGWWQLFRHRYPADEPPATLARVQEALHLSVDTDSDPLATWVDQALEVAETAGAVDTRGMLVGIGQTCLLHDRFPSAVRCSEPLLDQRESDVLLLRARGLLGQQRWEEAADAFHKVWLLDHANLAALFTSGDALQQAGRTAEGQQRQEDARRLALDSRARFRLARDLMRYDFRDEAIRQLQIVLRTAPFEHAEWNEAARLLSEAWEDTDPRQAVRLLEQSLLDDLRTQFYLLNYRDYLGSPARASRLRAAAAMKAKEFDRADEAIQRALETLPGDIDLAEKLVPRLEQAGREQEADELFDRVAGAYAKPLQHYPDSALLNNDFAWLMARCGRRVDQALTLAERAVRLEPDNAFYLDTLAEVQFRLGDRKKALLNSRRAVSLMPESDSLRQQLQRFESTPPPDH